MSELFSIQLQNRQQQGGDGVWLDLPTTTEQVQAALRQIGIWFTVPVILITFAWYISVLLPKKNVMSLKVASMYKAT